MTGALPLGHATPWSMVSYVIEMSSKRHSTAAGHPYHRKWTDQRGKARRVRPDDAGAGRGAAAHRATHLASADDNELRLCDATPRRALDRSAGGRRCAAGGRRCAAGGRRGAAGGRRGAAGGRRGAAGGRRGAAHTRRSAPSRAAKADGHGEGPRAAVGPSSACHGLTAKLVSDVRRPRGRRLRSERTRGAPSSEAAGRARVPQRRGTPRW
jgi:hypothetical protein